MLAFLIISIFSPIPYKYHSHRNIYNSPDGITKPRLIFLAFEDYAKSGITEACHLAWLFLYALYLALRSSPSLVLVLYEPSFLLSSLFHQNVYADV
jgi:hypothetical protein